MDHIKIFQSLSKIYGSHKNISITLENLWITLKIIDHIKYFVHSQKISNKRCCYFDQRNSAGRLNDYGMPQGGFSDCFTNTKLNAAVCGFNYNVFARLVAYLWQVIDSWLFQQVDNKVMGHS